MNRFGIFAFYDQDGVVDDYVTYYLNSLLPFFNTIICVVNGDITEQSQMALKDICSEVLIRPNEGFDIGGYKYGYSYIKSHYDLSNIDELVFFNSTVYGPIYPFEEMFGCMDSRNDIDFWGITHCRRSDIHKRPKLELEYTPEHIQSYFLSVRNNLLNSDDFDSYWENLPCIVTYDDAVDFHEVVFTSHFEKLGYKWDTYIKPSWYDDYYEYVLLANPIELLVSQRCPVIKRKSFVSPFKDQLLPVPADIGRKLYAFIKEKTDYDTSLITNNILRSETVSNYETSLTPTINIDEYPGNLSLDRPDVLAVLWIDNDTLINQYKRLHFETLADVIVICSDTTVEEKIQEILPSFTTVVSQKNGLSYLFNELGNSIFSHNYLWFSTNHGSLIDQIDSKMIESMEEMCKSTELFGDISKLRAILNSNPDICSLIPSPSQAQCHMLTKEELKTLSSIPYDLSASYTSCHTFFARSSMFTENLNYLEEICANEIWPTFVAACAKKEKLLVGIVTSTSIEQSKSLLYQELRKSLLLQNDTLTRLDKCRSFTDNFFTNTSIKERVWFLLMSLFPSFRKKVFQNNGFETSTKKVTYERSLY